MSLAILKQKQELKMKGEQLSLLQTDREALDRRNAELEQAIVEAKNDDDMKIVTDSVEAYEKDRAANDTAIEAVEKEMAELTQKIEEAETRARDAYKPPEEKMEKRKGGVEVKNETILRQASTPAECRERMQNAMAAEDDRAKAAGKEKSELRSFFENVITAVKNRAINGAELLVPEILVNMIEIDMMHYANILPLVDLRRIGGTGRLLFSGDAPEAVWVDNHDAVSELGDLNFKMMQIDAFKLAGFMAVSNSTLDDAFINLAAHIQQQMVKGFKISLDRAILNGLGASSKQPAGIIPAIPAKNKIQSAPDFKEYMTTYKHLPDDADVEAAVMTRETYFDFFQQQTVNLAANGYYVVGDTSNPRLPDGTRVVFVRAQSGQTNALAHGQVLTGQFSKYLLAQRAGMSLDISTEVRFIQDQTVFRIIGRYDGLAYAPEYFLLITLKTS